MNTRFYNARICTMNDFNIIEGELWVVGNKIEYVGIDKTNNIVFDREIDVQKNLILPGFKNCHTHSAMVFVRSASDDLTLLDWLDMVIPLEAKLTEDDVYHLSKLAIMEYLSSGITANFDMYYFRRQIAKASVDCGFRTVICGGVSNFYSSPQELEEDYLYFKDYHELISSQLGFHAEYTCSKEMLKAFADLAKKYKAPMYTHNSESYSEVEQCLDRTGMTPTAYINSFGIFDYGGGCFHGVHLTEEDMNIFKEKNLWLITNPGSNLKLASGIPKVNQMIDKDIKVAIGTDGPASNNCLDFFREMFLTSGLQKIIEKDASAVDALTVLKMATVDGADAIGLHDADTLSEGKLADLVIIDLNKPNMQPIHNILKNVVYSGSKQNVKLTMVNGNILYEDGKFNIGVDEKSVYKKSNEIIMRLMA